MKKTSVCILFFFLSVFAVAENPKATYPPTDSQNKIELSVDLADEKVSNRKGDPPLKTQEDSSPNKDFVSDTQEDSSPNRDFVSDTQEDSSPNRDFVSDTQEDSSPNKDFVSESKDPSFKKPATFSDEKPTDKTLSFYKWKEYLLEKITSLFISQKEDSSENSQSISQKKSKLTVKSYFPMKKNLLLPEAHSWSLAMPVFKWRWTQPLTPNSFFKMGLDLKHASYEFSDLFIQTSINTFIPVYFQAGYFEYPVAYRDKDKEDFIKKTFLWKNLFPSVDTAVGFLMKLQLLENLDWSMSLQGYNRNRETDSSPIKGVHPAFASRLVYTLKDQSLFLSYFQNQDVLTQPMKHWGLGANLLYKMNSFHFQFNGEFWNSFRISPDQDIITFYIFPSVNWKRLNLGVLLSQTYHNLPKDQSRGLEYNLVGDFYLTKNFLFRIERIQKQSQIITKDSWSFTLKAEFDIK